jgi:nitrite reductase (NADH) large subunit
MNEPKKNVVVIGNGMVGHRFLESLVERSKDVRLTVFCEEPRAAYDRVQLTSFFSGRSAADLSVVEPGFFEKHGIEILLGDRADSIDRERRIVRSALGREIGWDALVLATGSAPFVPPVPGREREGCFVYRTIEDLEAIRAAAKGAIAVAEADSFANAPSGSSIGSASGDTSMPPEIAAGDGSARRCPRGAVVGGGLLGLEAAKALHDLGLETHVVEFAPRLMAVQLDDTGASLLRRKIEALGVRVHTGKNTSEITDGEGGYRHRMNFAGGTSLDVDVIVFSAGIRPRDELARGAELALGERGGIAIDGACRTSDPAVFAIGECAAWNGKVYGLVAPGYEMARVAAAQVASCLYGSAAASVLDGGEAGSVPIGRDTDPAQFNGADMSTKLKLLGVEVASLGDAHATTLGARCWSFVDGRADVYKKLVVAEDGSRVLGAVLVGDTSDFATLMHLIQSGTKPPGNPEELILPPRADGTGKTSGPPVLPDAAQVCSCNNVSKGAICSAIDSGATTVGALKSCTKAGTSCGGCAPLVAQILKQEMARRGVATDQRLCEHLPFSRQQLFHLVRSGEIRDFDTLIEKHGRGRGCDVCKPAVASILASTWNEFVISPERQPLQDTNDRYLANMQKDGTYSIVPRVAGGEITPDKLIAIGQVAKKYGLYTKITGGQRIDLFGAHVHQLPEIWRELIAAGFESGHAYGKALRTVKSCVGSTWCRFGVQDSVRLAIDLENRYKGLRAPHKIKLAVSGCTRECAEARGKDVGVIATEKGWNLYVCGNGGMKPRHADLLASDLDEETLVRFIDRFLMFYVRTADRLQRTSTWLENLEGGLDYLRAVVCEDSLGLAASLEEDMKHVVATYECEWKKAVEDPATLRRFRHFINDDRADPDVLFIEERGQLRPATRAEAAEHEARKVLPIEVQK